MPPFFDEAQIHNALRNEALPELARLADNDRLRDRAVRRFDRDEPPPYVSSTEDEDEFGYEPPLGFEGSAVLDEFADLITPPLTDAERDSVATELSYDRKVSGTILASATAKRHLGDPRPAQQYEPRRR